MRRLLCLLQVDSLIRSAEEGASPPTSSAPPPHSAIDAEVVSTNGVPSNRKDHLSSSRSNQCERHNSEEDVDVLDVRTVRGLVALTIDALASGQSDEAVVMKRHLRSPDFGHPLLVLATPSGKGGDFPHMPGDEVGVF